MSEINLLLIEVEKELLWLKERLHKRNEQYKAMLAFINKASKSSCCLVCDCLPCDALQLLREFGEDK